MESIVTSNLIPTLRTVLKKRFYFNEFRPGQLEAITTLFNRGRLLCIQPTGHGKSLLYQLPAALLEGVTLVISPLLALMRDQIGQLNERFFIPAATINSDQKDIENYRAQQMTREGKVKILFIAPEKLDHIDYFEFLLNLPVHLIVIDEAHCISVWGHDFRPSYRQIINFVHAAEQKNENLKVLAITATANQRTEADIKKQLTRVNQQIIVQRQSMDRPNIHLSVIDATHFSEKLYFTEQLLSQLMGCGLIYCATRENTEMVAEYLQSKRLNVVAYHAGMDADAKRLLQQNFINNRYKAIAATNALGMGIDKQDLRFIIHFDIPGSITAYYQEVGRCGRDGKLAQGILLFDEADQRIQQYFIDSAQPTASDFEQIIQCIKQSNVPLHLTAIKELSGLHPNRLTVVLAELLEQEFVGKQKQNGRQVYYLMGKKGQPDFSRYDNQFQVRTHELTEMLHYARQKSECLMQKLRNALGDTNALACGHCSACLGLSFSIQKEKSKMVEIQQWLSDRPSTISLARKNRVSDGVAVLDGKLRSMLFIEFMKTRATKNQIINNEFLYLIERHLEKLKKVYLFGAVIAIPSRTWCGRETLARFIADYLKATVLTDYLQWRRMPSARQGELMNNDQRRHNVARCMQYHRQRMMPQGAILLLDDYVGSGATIQEAVRVLRQEAKLPHVIVPFTIARVQWRLGKRGMI